MQRRLCPLLKSFAKFETNSPGMAAFSRMKTMRNVRFCSLSIQNRGEIEFSLLKIVCESGNGRLWRARPVIVKEIYLGQPR